MTRNKVSDEELVAAARHGDRRAFSDLIRRHRPGVYGLMMRMVRSKEDAEDLSQEAFLRAFRNLEGFRGEASFKSWLYRIASNLALNHLSRRRTRGTEEEAAVASLVGVGGPSGALDRDTLLAHVRAAIDELPPRQKTALLLRVEHELSFKEIAHAMSCSLGTAKANVHFATKSLRKRLDHLVAEVGSLHDILGDPGGLS